MTEQIDIPKDKKLCACGYCNEKIELTLTSHGVPKRFKWGHNSKGKNHPNWKGGRSINYASYIEIWKPDHPRASQRGYVFKHILIMEETLNRYLKPHEIVHHKDGNKQNNLKNNLELMTKAQHNKLHKTIDMSNRKCLDCGSDTNERRWHIRGLLDDQYRCSNCASKIWWSKNKDSRNKKRRKNKI